MLRHGQEGEGCGVACVRLVSLGQRVQGVSMPPGTILRSAQSGEVLARLGGERVGRFSLAECEAILDRVEVLPPDQSPGRLIVALGVGLFMIALDER